MISRKRVRDFNKILTCLLCKGYLIEATTINTCMHSFCRSCIVKHIKLFETCPTCESEIRLGNLRSDYRLQSIVYKIIPGLYAKERQKITNDGYEHRVVLNGSGATLVNKLYDVSNEDETLAKQYFYDPEEPISLSLEYHMESIFGSNNISSLSNNIPQVRYLQAPAAFKVLHLKKFLSSKYDLGNLKKPMCIDIIYEGDVLADEFTLMDVAYTYKWEREAPLKLFYRIYKSKKHNSASHEINLIKKALADQPFVRLSKEECCEEPVRKVSAGHNHHHNNNASSSHHNGSSSGKRSHQNSSPPESQPRRELKIIIAKKPNSKVLDASRLNKSNGGGSSYISKVLGDSERLRGNVDNFTSSAPPLASTSEMKTTSSKKTGTVSHHDSKFENKSGGGGSGRHNSNNNNNKNSSGSNSGSGNSDSHDSYEFTVNEGGGEKERQKRENTKHTNSSSSSSAAMFSSSAATATAATGVEKFKVKSSLSLNIPKLKIELPSLKTNITIPKTPNESYAISKSPFSNNAKCEPQVKKVRFDMSGTTSHRDRCYDFDDDAEAQTNSCFDQRKYAERIGLRPVERKVESIILHRKRKKSKHSREMDSHSSKKPKLHVSSSSLDDESLKLKLKIMGGSSSKRSDKRFNNNEEEASAKTCNFKAADAHHSRRQEKHKEAVAEPLENHKYSVTEQRITKSSDAADQPLVFIPKLVLQKTSISTPSSSSSSAEKSGSKQKEADAKGVQRRNSLVKDQVPEKSQPKSTFDAEKSKDVIKLKIKPLDKLAPPTTTATSAAVTKATITPVIESKASDQPSKLMKPPTAKMGSPSSALASSPIRPNSIPASLKLSPITATTASPTISVKSDLQLQCQSAMKRSLSLGAEKSPHCYINPYAKTNTEMFTRDPPLVKIPPLIPTSSAIRNFYINNSSSISSFSNSEQIAKVAPVTISKVPNINVKDPMKLFPNACPSVEILKIPQAAQQQPTVRNVKLNRQMPPTTIPLERIKQSAQLMPKVSQQQPMKLQSPPTYQQPKINLTHTGSDLSSLAYNSQEPCHSPITNDISLERYQYELSKDLSMLDRSLSLEKNFEHWGKMKLQEFSKISDLKSMASSPMAKSLLLSQQNMSLSVRHIPNPSALMMFRNQSNGKAQAASPTGKNAVSSSTSEQCSDLEDIISKSTISKASEFSSLNFLQRSFAPTSFSLTPTTTTAFAGHGKINDKKSIEKLTEYLRQTATAAKSKQEMKQDDDNNNNSASPRNDKNFNLIDGGRQQSSSMDVICIDS